jgi:hypothetical protein
MEPLQLMVEVVGCETVCRHCWARGAPYGAMPLREIARVLEGAERACDAAGLRLVSFPMHEVAAHPDVGDVLDLFTEHGGAGQFEPFVTTGVPLAARDDWRSMLEAVARNRGRTIWVHVHGTGDTHDDTVSLAGAYQDTLVAVRRATEYGLRAGSNVFVTAANVDQIEPAMLDLLDAGAHGLSVEVASYYPHARIRHAEANRPTPADLEALVTRLRGYRDINHASAIWDDLPGRTEAAWYRKAIDGQWQENETRMRQIVCRADLGVHQGAAGTYGAFFGNLATGDHAEIWARAVAAPPTSRYEVAFGPVDESIDQIARANGKPDGEQIHFLPQSMRAAWLDRSEHRPTTFLRVGRSRRPTS